MSRHESNFSQAVGDCMADWFGRNRPSTTIHSTGVSSPVETNLDWVVLGDEQRTFRRGQNYEAIIVYTVYGWLITDRNQARFSGITRLNMHDKIKIDGQIYMVAWVGEREGESIVDFRLERTARKEMASNDLRGR